MKNNIYINTQSSIKIVTDKIILIFITHDHYDHLDYDSINKVKKDNTLIILPDSIAPQVLGHKIVNSNQIIGVNPNETYNISDLDIETIPSYNLNKPFHPKNNKYVGYIITLDEKRLYISGDTDVTPEAQAVKCDIALIPIGGKFTCDYQEAAALINTIKPQTVIPTHYGNIDDGEKFKSLLNPDIECVLKIK